MNMLDNKKTIGEREYIFGIIPPVESVPVQLKLVKMLAKPIAAAIKDVDMTILDGKTGEKLEGEEKPAAANLVTPEDFDVGAIIAGLADALNEADVMYLINAAFKYTTFTTGGANAKRVEINQDFNGRPGEMWQVVGFCLFYNFKGIFPAGLSNSIQERAAGLMRKVR